MSLLMPGNTGRYFGAVLVLVFTLGAFPCSANPVRGEFWVKDDLMEIVSPGENSLGTGDLTFRQEKALEALLEDARWAFSGMIYGFSVRWTPPAGSRDIEEELLIEPLALIPRADPRMKTVSLSMENGFLYILLEYSPDETQERRLEGWKSEAFPAASGRGIAPVDRYSRRDAMEAAIRETIRSYLRVRDYNRPRKITGRVAFTGFPFTSLISGSVSAVVRLRMDFEPLEHYVVD